MIDGYGRVIDHLRLSLTDSCNLACRYCVPGDAEPPASTAGGIEADFAFQAVRWLSRHHGIRCLRLTGGEPLLYRPLLPLIERLAGLNTLYNLTLTTNGQALATMASRLRDAGLARVNISLDTLDPRRFARLTRGGDLRHTLRGVEAAVSAGLTPVKVNVVVQRGINDRDLPRIARWGLARGCVVRFLEAMPIGPVRCEVDRSSVPASEIMDRLGACFTMRPAPQLSGQPSTDYRATDGLVNGVLGVIASTTRPFCASCRRMRLSAAGRLVPCLHDRRTVSLADAWDGRRIDAEAADRMLAEAVAAKPSVGPRNQSMTMVTVGG